MFQKLSFLDQRWPNFRMSMLNLDASQAKHSSVGDSLSTLVCYNLNNLFVAGFTAEIKPTHSGTLMVSLPHLGELGAHLRQMPPLCINPARCHVDPAVGNSEDKSEEITAGQGKVQK